MEDTRSICFEPVTKDDVEAMTMVMKRAFDEDSRRHLGTIGGPPGYDDGEFIRKWYLGSNADAYKIVKDGVIIGGVNVFHRPNHSYMLGNIFLDPEAQDQGIGTKVWKSIEKKYADAKKWETETPGFSKRNHNFYVNKCGFHIIKIENPKDLMEASYIMKKVIE